MAERLRKLQYVRLASQPGIDDDYIVCDDLHVSWRYRPGLDSRSFRSQVDFSATQPAGRVGIDVWGHAAIQMMGIYDTVPALKVWLFRLKQ